MSLYDDSRQRVEAALDRLRARFGTFETVRDGRTVDEHRFDRVGERFDAGTVGGADCWVRNPDGEVLFVRREDERTWAPPGGKHEPGERLEETAVRETREETGLEPAVTGVALAQVVEFRPETDRDGTDDGRRLVRLISIFEGESSGGDPRPRPGEIAATRWFDRHPDQLLYDRLAELEVPASGTGE